MSLFGVLYGQRNHWSVNGKRSGATINHFFLSELENVKMNDF